MNWMNRYMNYKFLLGNVSFLYLELHCSFSFYEGFAKATIQKKKIKLNFVSEFQRGQLGGHVYSPHCSPDIFCGNNEENLFCNQYLGCLLFTSFFLTTLMFD